MRFRLRLGRGISTNTKTYLKLDSSIPIKLGLQVFEFEFIVPMAIRIVIKHVVKILNFENFATYNYKGEEWQPYSEAELVEKTFVFPTFFFVSSDLLCSKNNTFKL